MIQQLNASEFQYVSGGINETECNCLDINHNIVSSSQKAKNENDCWKICCKDGAPKVHVYAQYGKSTGSCMVDEELTEFLKWKAGKKNSESQHKTDGL